MTFDQIFSDINLIANTKERKSTQELALKAGEEVGELQEAVLSATHAPGCGYKNKTWDDVDEEAVDVIIISLATALKGAGSLERLKPIFERKMAKWQEKLG